MWRGNLHIICILHCETGRCSMYSLIKEGYREYRSLRVISAPSAGQEVKQADMRRRNHEGIPTVPDFPCTTSCIWSRADQNPTSVGTVQRFRIYSIEQKHILNEKDTEKSPQWISEGRWYQTLILNNSGTGNRLELEFWKNDPVIFEVSISLFPNIRIPSTILLRMQRNRMVFKSFTIILW